MEKNRTLTPFFTEKNKMSKSKEKTIQSNLKLNSTQKNLNRK